MTLLFETKRLIVKVPVPDDLDFQFALQSDPDVMRYIGDGPRTREKVKEVLDKAIQHQSKHGFSLGSVFEKESGSFVGRAGIIYLGFDDTQDDIEIGYALLKNFWNKGYALELARFFITWGFKHLNVNKLVAVTQLENEKSRRVLEKAGMYYARQTQYQGHTIAYYEILSLRIDPAKIKLIPATLSDYPVMQNMERFYAYDISEYLGHGKGWEMPESGLFECIDFKKYWEIEGFFPFFIRYGNELAGFVIVGTKGTDPEVNFDMVQFYIVRKFQHKGLGGHVAYQCFEKFKGVWEARILSGNEGSYRSCRSVIKRYTHNDFIEYTKVIPERQNTEWNIFRFTTGKRNHA